MSLLSIELELSWQPWQPHHCRAPSCASSSHGLLSGGGCLIEYCKTHPSSDEASHLAVLSCPFTCGNASDPLFSGASLLVSHTIDGVQHGGEVSMPFETCLLILTLFLKCCALQNFLRSAIPIPLSVRITDLNVKNSCPSSLPKCRALPHLHGLVARVEELASQILFSLDIPNPHRSPPPSSSPASFPSSTVSS